MTTEDSAAKRSLICAAGIVAVIAASSPVLAQQGPEAGPARGNRQALEISATPVEPGAVIGGGFNSPKIRDLAAYFIRTQGGRCDAISRAQPAAAGQVVVSCNENENTYYMERKGKAWSFAIPAGAGR